MIAELVDLSKNEKVLDELFAMYCHCSSKGLPKAEEKNQMMRNALVECAIAEFKQYCSFHNYKMDGLERTIDTLNLTLRNGR